MKFARWCVINAAFMSLLLAGISGWAPGLAIFTFWVWVLFAIMLAATLTEAKADEPIQNSVPRWLDIGYDVVVTSILAGSSHYMLAVFYLLTMFMQHLFIERSKKSPAVS